MNRYIEFNAVKFLKESTGWKKEKAALTEEMNSLADLQRAGTATGKPGKPSDSTAAAVVERGRLQSQIDRLNFYQEALTYAWNRLSKEYRDALTAFFFTPGYMPPIIEAYGQKYALCRSDVYKMRREALAELSRLITRRYGL